MFQNVLLKLTWCKILDIFYACEYTSFSMNLLNNFYRKEFSHSDLLKVARIPRIPSFPQATPTRPSEMTPYSSSNTRKILPIPMPTTGRHENTFLLAYM